MVSAPAENQGDASRIQVRNVIRSVNLLGLLQKAIAKEVKQW
jgi:hypothetical protein